MFTMVAEYDQGTNKSRGQSVRSKIFEGKSYRPSELEGLSQVKVELCAEVGDGVKG